MASFMDRLKTSYNLFKVMGEGVEVQPEHHVTSMVPSMMNTRVSFDSTQAVLAPILTRISIDAAAIPLRHIMVDSEDEFVTVRKSELNDRLSIMANIDQTGRAFIQDSVKIMLEEGAVALVPVEFTSRDIGDPALEILSIRAGIITEWFNRSVQVSVYNEMIGERVEKTLPKHFIAIAYNPLYSVMNDRNSTLRRLINKLALLDRSDSATYSNNLDLILQMSFALKNDRLAAEAQRRIENLEEQLSNTRYGIGYIDANEKITQLNRPVNNALVENVASLTDSLHSQLGLTPNVFSGEASQEEMIAYNNRTVLPIMNALGDAMIGAFFSRTSIRQGHRVRAIPDLFKMVPLTQFSEAADSLTRNEIMTSNEIRAQIGLRPSLEPEADNLRNKNLNKSNEAAAGGAMEAPIPIAEPVSQPPSNGSEEPKE